MVMIEAVIKPYVLERVRKSLDTLGVGQLTEYSVSDFGAEPAHREIYQGLAYNVDSVPRIKVDIVIPESMEDRVVAAIAEGARTDAGNSGSILVFPGCKTIQIGRN